MASSKILDHSERIEAMNQWMYHMKFITCYLLSAMASWQPSVTNVDNVAILDTQDYCIYIFSSEMNKMALASYQRILYFTFSTVVVCLSVLLLPY
jgi:hypothetical protein